MQPSFDLSFDQNVAAFGTAQPVVDISVKVIDIAGNLSTAVTATATNPIPANVTGFTATGIPLAISLSWDASVETDFKTYEIYMSTTSGFTPGAGNLITKTSSNSFVLPTSNFVVQYFKIRQVDVFDQSSAAYASVSATPQNTSSLDTTPPDAPTAVTVASASDGNGGSAHIDVSWTASTSSSLAGYVVRFSTDQVSWQYVNVPSNQTTAKISNLPPNTAYYVSVASISYVSSYSAFVNASTGGYPITTAKDTVAPSMPSIPTVSFGTSMVQVSHSLTKSGGGALESDIRYLEVHGSTVTGFTPTSTTLFGTIDVPAPGIAVSATFNYTPNDSVINMYWKVIAVDYSGNKSPASSQATGVPGLIQGANIADATITNAKINDLSAAKLTAGTAFVNNLSVRSALTLDAATGFVQSSNFSIPSKTGWRLDQNGLVINDGSIASKSLLLQNGNNIAPPPFADFEFGTDYYHDVANIANAAQLTATSGMLLNTVFTGQKVGKQAMRIYNTSIANTVTHTLHFATGGQAATGVNIDVNPGDYIYSIWAKKNGAVDQNINLGIYTDSGVAIESANTLINSTTMSRYSAVLTVPSGVSKVKMYIDLTPVTTGYDIVIDALQLEPKLTADITPSAWKPPSTTVIDGGSVITGSIRSSASAASVSGQPAWSINTQGNMQLGDALVRGRIIVGAGSDTKNRIKQTYTSFEDPASTYYDANNIFNPATLNTNNSNFRFALQTTGSPPQGLQAMRIYGSGFPAGDTHHVFFGPASPLNITDLIPGQNYILSAWVKSNDTTKSPKLRLGTYGPTSSFRWASAAYVPTSAWTRVSGVISGVVEDIVVFLEIALGAAETIQDISIDGMQLEVAPDGTTAPSTWQIGAVGSVVSAVQSTNYVAGSKGWVINSDGTVEFNTSTIRGQLNVMGTAGEIDVIPDAGGIPTIYFYTPDKSHYAYINSPKLNGVYTLGINSGDRITSLDNVTTIRDRLYFQNNQITLGSIKMSNQASVGGQTAVWDTGAALSFDSLNGVLTSQILVNQGLISIQSGDGVNGMNGPGLFFGATNIQFKTTINQTNPVQYNQAIGFLDVGGQGWTDLALTNNWIWAGGNWARPQYKLMPDGTVMLRGAVLPPVGPTPPAVTAPQAFNLPVGFRPPLDVNFTVSTATTPNATPVGIPRIQIDGATGVVGGPGTGTVSGYTPGNSIRLDGVRFSVI